MTDPTICCPNCCTEIHLTESLAGPLLAATRREFECKLADKDSEIAGREAALRGQQEAITKARSEIDQQVLARVQAERKRISEEATERAKRDLAADIEQKALELAELQQTLRERDDKLREAQKAHADLLRKERELEDTRRELDLTIEKQVNASLAQVREKAKLEAEEGLRLRVAEKEELIFSMQRQIDELKRRAEQGSQQLQGEVQELALETLLRSKFPLDVIEPVPKGEFGGDVLHRVIGPLGQKCGTILWESKRTKNWADTWLPKLREDQRKAKADIALIVSNTLPRGVHTFDRVDGVWVTEARCAIPVALALRQSLLDLSVARQARDGQQTKMEMTYQYLIGPRFKQRVEAIVEKFSDMQYDLDKERRAMMKLWAKREAQIRGVIEATAGMYGDLQGIAGKALDEIETFGLPLIENEAGVDDGSAIAA